MEFKIVQKAGKKHQLFIVSNADALPQVTELSDGERQFVANAFKKDQSSVTVNQYNRYFFFFLIKEKKSDPVTIQTLCMKYLINDPAKTLPQNRKI